MSPAILAFACVLLFAQAPVETGLGEEATAIRSEREISVENNRVQPLRASDRTTEVMDHKMTDLEHSRAFKKAAEDAWHAAHNGSAPFETGFAIDENGRPGKLQSSIFAPDENAHHLRLVFSPTCMATFHVHNKFGEPEPSPHDVEIAKTKHMTMYVGSRDGLYAVDPDGNVRHVFTSPTWFDQK